MSPSTRPAAGRRLDRLLTPLFRGIDRLLRRPSEATLQGLTGRHRGGKPEVVDFIDPRALEEGRRLLAEGQIGEALLAFADAARAEPENPWPWHGRGDALQSAGE